MTQSLELVNLKQISTRQLFTFLYRSRQSKLRTLASAVNVSKQHRFGRLTHRTQVLHHRLLRSELLLAFLGRNLGNNSLVVGRSHCLANEHVQTLQLLNREAGEWLRVLRVAECELLNDRHVEIALAVTTESSSTAKRRLVADTRYRYRREALKVSSL